MDKEIILLPNDTGGNGLNGNGMTGNGMSGNGFDVSMEETDFEKLIQDFV